MTVVSGGTVNMPTSTMVATSSTLVSTVKDNKTMMTTTPVTDGTTNNILTSTTGVVAKTINYLPGRINSKGDLLYH